MTRAAARSDTTTNITGTLVQLIYVLVGRCDMAASTSATELFESERLMQSLTELAVFESEDGLRKRADALSALNGVLQGFCRAIGSRKGVWLPEGSQSIAKVRFMHSNG